MTKSASSLGRGIPGTLGDPSGILRVLTYTRFGSLLQWRWLLLAALLAIAFWEFLAEREPGDEQDQPGAAGRALPALMIAGLASGCLALLSSQGHASQAPVAALSVLDDALHLISVSVWIGGLAGLALLTRGVARVAPTGGPPFARALLASFSPVALTAVSVAVLTGTARAVGELADPAQLWQTAYGRSIVLKIALLWPVAFVAFRNRRVIVALAHVRRPNPATLRLITRNARIELALALTIVMVAALLVAQAPGRT